MKKTPDTGDKKFVTYSNGFADVIEAALRLHAVAALGAVTIGLPTLTRAQG